MLVHFSSLEFALKPWVLFVVFSYFCLSVLTSFCHCCFLFQFVFSLWNLSFFQKLQIHPLMSWLWKNGNASQVCVSTLRRGHNAILLCIAPMLVCVVMYSRSNACCLHLWYLTSEIWYLSDLPICWCVSVSSFFFPMPKASKTRWEFSPVNKTSIWK